MRKHLTYSISTIEEKNMWETYRAQAQPVPQKKRKLGTEDDLMEEQRPRRHALTTPPRSQRVFAGRSRAFAEIDPEGDRDRKLSRFASERNPLSFKKQGGQKLPMEESMLNSLKRKLKLW